MTDHDIGGTVPPDHAPGAVRFALDTTSPPHNLEAERGVLGAVLLDNDLLLHLCDLGLRASDYYRTAHGDIWRAMVALDERCVPIDYITLTDQILRHGSQVTLADLAGAVEGCPQAANALYYADIVIRAATLRRLIAETVAINRLAHEYTGDTGPLLDDAEARMGALSETRGRMASTVTLGEALRDAIRDGAGGVDPETAEWVAPSRIPTGLASLDEHLGGGLTRGNLALLIAGQKVGKTSLALGWLMSAVASGSAALYVTLEMSAAALASRAHARESQVPHHAIRDGWLTPDQEERYGRVGLLISGLKERCLVDHRTDGNWEAMIAQTRRTIQRQGIGLVVIDYLQLFAPRHRADQKRYSEIDRMSREAKELAVSARVAVVLIAQTNGAHVAERRPPAMGDLADGKSPGKHCDLALLLHRPGADDPAADSRRATLLVRAYRQGANADIPLTWWGDCTRYDDAADWQEPREA